MTPNNGKNMVLVVDDDGDLRPLFKQSLEGAGYLTASVKTSEEAISWLGENRADLMLLDYLLPDMTGEKLVDALSEKGILIPFVVVTGRGSERVAVKLMKRGALDYIIKGPSMLELLPQVVAHAFEQLEKQKQLTESEKKTRRLELLGKIDTAAGSSLEPQELFKAVVSEIRRVIPCERYVIATMDLNTGRQPLAYLESDIDFPKGQNFSGGTHWWFRVVSEEHQPLAVDDLREVPFPRAQEMAKAGFRSHIVVPILHENQIAAYLGLMSTKVAAFTKEHEDFLVSVARLLSPRIQNAMLHKESEERAKRLDISSKIARAAGSALEPGALFKTVVDEIRRVVPCERCLIGVTSRESDLTIVWHIESDIDVKLSPASTEAVKLWGHSLPVTARVVYHPDISGGASPRARELAEAGFRSVLRVPILSDGEYQAHIGLGSTRIDGFTQEQIDLLVSVADHLGPVVRNAALYRESEERGKRLAALVEASQQMTRGLNLDDVLASLAESAAKVFDGDAGFRLLEGSHLVRIGATPGALLAMAKERIRVGESLSGRVAETGEPLISMDAANEPRILPESRAGIREDRTGAMMCVPIRFESRVLGILDIYRERFYRFEEVDLKIAMSLADQAAIAICNARLYNDSENRRERLELANEIAMAVSSKIEPDELFRTIVGGVRRAIPCAWCLLAETDSEKKVHRYLYFESDVDLSPQGIDALSRHRLDILYDEKRPVRVADYAEIDSPIARALSGAGLRSSIFIPIIQGDRCIAHFGLGRCEPDAFTDEDEEFLVSIAGHISSAIQNARLHEEAMKSLQFFQSVVDDNADAIVVRDLDYNILHWNRGAEKIFGYTQEEALGKSAKILYPEGEWENSPYSEMVNWGKISLEDIPLREAVRLRKDGSSVPVIAIASPVKNQQGDVIALSIIFKDLTEQKRTEAELIEQENRLRTIVNNAAVDGIITIDENGIVESINPSAQEIFGCMSGEIEGKKVSLLMPDSFKEEHDGYLEKYIRTGIMNIIGSTREVLGRRADGSKFPMDLTVTEIWARGRRIFTGIVRDLTEKKQAEEERREYVDILLKLNALTQKMNTSLDLDEVLDVILDSTKSLLGVSDVSISTKIGEYFVPKAGMGEYYTARLPRRYELGRGGVGEAAQRGSSVFIESVLDYPGWKNKDHARRYNIKTCLCVPLKNVQGVVIGVLSCLTQEARKYSVGEFELIDSFVNMAAIAIQNAENHSNLRDTLEELGKSQEMIIRAEKLSSLGTLAAGAAHEILNPAGVIQLRAEIIAEESPEGELVNQSADVIVRSVRRIKGICDDLRRFSRNEVSSKEPFEPGDALMSSLDLIKHRLSPANIELDMNLGNSQPIVIGDVNQIQQVFLNLISNAIDAMPKGGKISISSSELRDDGDQYWEVRVADTGTGISETDLPQIFDPFFTTKSPDEGTGLGLSVLHGIVGNHGGEVFVESEEGKGTEFIVRLPMAKDRVGL